MSEQAQEQADRLEVMAAAIREAWSFREHFGIVAKSRLAARAALAYLGFGEHVPPAGAVTEAVEGLRRACDECEFSGCAHCGVQQALALLTGDPSPAPSENHLQALEAWQGVEDAEDVQEGAFPFRCGPNVPCWIPKGGGSGQCVLERRLTMEGSRCVQYATSPLWWPNGVPVAEGGER